MEKDKKYPTAFVEVNGYRFERGHAIEVGKHQRIDSAGQDMGLCSSEFGIVAILKEDTASPIVKINCAARYNTGDNQQCFQYWIPDISSSK